jgi:hypothetical protein
VRLAADSKPAHAYLSGKVLVNDLYSAFKVWAEQSRKRHNLRNSATQRIAHNK